MDHNLNKAVCYVCHTEAFFLSRLSEREV